MGLFDIFKQNAKPERIPHEVILAGIHAQNMNWVHSIFMPIQHHLDRQLRHEYLVAFSGMIVVECYLFAMGLKRQQPSTVSIINFIQNLSDILTEDGVHDPEAVLREMMVEYRDLFTRGMTSQNMYELCSEFTYHYTLLEGLDDQIENLNDTIQVQCNIITRSISELL